MEFRQERQIPAGRIVGNAVLAVAAGALMPVIGLLQISLLVPVLMLSGILAARLWARAGMIPAGLMIGTLTAVQTEAGGQIEYGIVEPQANLDSLVQVFIVKDFTVVE